MGSCLSKKTNSSPLNPTKKSFLILTKNEIEYKNQNNKVVVAVRNPKEGKEEEEEEKEVKNIKEVQEVQEQEHHREKCESASVVRHRKSHDRRAEARCSSPEKNKNLIISEPEKLSDCTPNFELVTGARTSSCTREELDAILIQCGRLSRSNSGVNQRKYSGSKRSFDFDQNEKDSAALDDGSVESAKKEECDDIDDKRQHRQRHRQTNRPSSPGRRRTPSREQQSGSRERANDGGSGRRVSRSPGRRSENGQTSTNSSNTNVGVGGDNINNNRLAKMVSVPASVIQKGDNGVESQAIKRVSVKRNASGGAVAASPRSKSPATTNGSNNSKAAANGSYNQQQQPSPSRSYTRKAEYSPYRRNPLSEIDPNSLAYTQVAGNKVNTRAQVKNKDIDAMVKDSVNVQQIQATVHKPNNKLTAQGSNCEGNKNAAISFDKLQTPMAGNITINATVPPESEDPKPQTLTRTRSARRSRDLDLNPEALLNPPPSYTALLLEDIQNFHQKSSNGNSNKTESFTLPPCVTKACSIMEAVADLNSTTNSTTNLSSDKRRSVIVESEVVHANNDDLTEPSLHKYITVRRGMLYEDLDGQESSGSNSIVGGVSQQNWGYSTSSWELNSADSTDRWVLRSNTTEEVEKSPLAGPIQRLALSETAHDARRGFSGQRTRTGLGRVVSTA